jgi:hypothetical protein
MVGYENVFMPFNKSHMGIEVWCVVSQWSDVLTTLNSDLYVSNIFNPFFNHLAAMKDNRDNYSKTRLKHILPISTGLLNVTFFRTK